MGVPSFYRWLSKKYPKIVMDVVEEKAVEVAGGLRTAVDTARPNPNGFEIDCLYLDMNGIIHPCCHPEGEQAPDDEDEMIQRVFLYIDRIFAMCRPRKVLYMAIDGVAPRAKMNQQRSRRFRSAKEVTDKEIAEDELRREWEDKGLTPPPRKQRPWDSNVITPGTPFMAKLSRALHWYIYDRMGSESGWRGIKVIFSDAKVPGEGEHKIMNFIRRQRASPGYDPNMRHCIYGMDADLIMLGLATHEPHFLVIRETIIENRQQQAPRCFLCGQTGHRADACSGVLEEETKKAAVAKAAAAPEEAHDAMGLMEKPFQFLLLNVLREYLAHDLIVPNLPFAWDLERALDDFVFLCFFVGNDFLPHLPLLEIREGAIERLVGIYKRLLPSLGGYISENGGQLNLSRVDVLLSDLGVVEDSIFKQRKSKEDYFKQRDANRSAQLTARRTQTMAARESAQRFADEQGYSAVKGGINTHTKALQPHVKKEMMRQGAAEIKNEINNEPLSDIVGKKRKSVSSSSVKIEEIDEADAAAAPDASPESAKAVTKKKKLEDGAAAAAAVARDVADAEGDGEEDGADPAYKPSKNDSSSSSESESASDDEEDADAKKKSKKRKLKQQMKKEAERKKKEAAAEGDDDDAKMKGEESVDNLAQGSTAASASVLDKEAAELDFGAILNAKLRKMERPGDDEETDPDAPPRDPVRFGEDGWKERYYHSKMHIDRSRKEDGVIFHKLFKSYAEGLCWVMRYYYSGCASWNWWYPFHYAPMASDLCNLDRYKIDFELSQPFTPMGQLMGVLPALSAHALPVPCQELMMNPMSPIIDFYPENFPLDLNGKKALWQAVALLPWIEEKRLLTELAKVEPEFTPEEKDRNSLGCDYLFVHKTHLLANSIYALYMSHPVESLQGKTPLQCAEVKKMEIDMAESGGMSGSISPYVPQAQPGDSLASEVGLGTVEDVAVWSVVYHDPPERPHRCELLPGLIPPPPVLDEQDLDESVRGGPASGFQNQSRNNRQRDAQRQQGVSYGGGSQGQAQHGGQAQAPAPRFGAAPSHFNQGAVGDRIWSSGYNNAAANQQGGQQQQGQGQYNRGGGRGGRGGYQQQQGGRGGYQSQQYGQQQQQGGYQQQQQQGYGGQQAYQTQGYAAAAGGQSQRGGYQHNASSRGGYQHGASRGGYGGQSSYAPQQYAPQQQAPPQQYQQVQPSGYSHARSAPPAGSANPFAALQQQVQSHMQAHHAAQQQQPGRQ